jgi:hypothetical protein
MTLALEPDVGLLHGPGQVRGEHDRVEGGQRVIDGEGLELMNVQANSGNAAGTHRLDECLRIHDATTAGEHQSWLYG